MKIKNKNKNNDGFGEENNQGVELYIYFLPTYRN